MPSRDPILAACLLLAAAGACTESTTIDADAAQDFDRCEVTSDCLVISESCCGTCGAPTRGDALAIHRDRVGDQRRLVCAPSTGCPACAPLFVDPTLMATCRAGRCELVDLQMHAVTECAQDDDCVVRTPDCCECGGDTEPGRLLGIASSAQADYSALACDPETPCPECAPLYPSEVSVQCGASGHCETQDARLP